MYETGQFSETWFWNEIDKRDNQIRKLEAEIEALKKAIKNVAQTQTI